MAEVYALPEHILFAYTVDETEESELINLINEPQDDPQPSPGPSTADPSQKKSSQPRRQGEVPNWQQKRHVSTCIALNTPEWLGSNEFSIRVKLSTEYFRSFFSDDVMDNTVHQSKLCCAKKFYKKSELESE